MKDQASFRRKVIYLTVMALLLVPLSLISRPSFVNPEGQTSEGGLLTRMRSDYGLSQANLGEIDPASESMKLATLGMRGVASNILWGRANEYKKKEDWDNLTATLNQITKLQPNFISVWQFQSWNLSYNVSVEFDNYRHRYHWVKKGIDFLMEGTTYNRNEPRLLWDLGWFFGHKFGRSDEYRQFRRIYRTDNDFHDTLPVDQDRTRGPDGQPDNWLTAHEWFAEAQRVVDQEGKPIKGKNPLVFHSDPPKALIRFAEAIEEEGYLDDKAKVAWINAEDDWLAYGDRDIPATYGYKIRLNEVDTWQEEAERLKAELDRLLPGVREQIRQQRLASLSPKERELLQTPRIQWGNDYDLGLAAVEKAEVTHEDVAARAPAELRTEVRRLVSKIHEAEDHSRTIRRYRDVVNYQYWRTRCEVEQTDRAIQARRYLFEADQAYEKADLLGARDKYEEAWKRWSIIHRNHPELADDVTADDLVDAIQRYRLLLGQMDEPFPPPGFPMIALVEARRDEFDLTEEQIEAAKVEPPATDGGDQADDAQPTAAATSQPGTPEEPTAAAVGPAGAERTGNGGGQPVAPATQPGDAAQPASDNGQTTADEAPSEEAIPAPVEAAGDDEAASDGENVLQPITSPPR
jgi:hypothetical protein